MGVKLSENKRIILYGTGLAALLLLLRWLEFRYLVLDLAMEVYIGAIAIVFTGLGIWLALKLAGVKKETIIVEKQVFVKAGSFIRNSAEVEKTGISPRELEVLELMAQGLSNAEVAEKLFVSLNTVKTHSSKIFEKLGVKRRTQAVEMARKLSIIP